MAKSSGLKKSIFNFSKGLINLTDIINPHITALIDLSLRVWIGLIFWKSGVMKITNWDVALMLFEDEHPVPYLSPDIAAILGTANELILPILLLIGFGSRIAAIGLLISTAIIQFTYQYSHEHFLWALVLFSIFIRGAGLYSIDYFLRGKYMGSYIQVGRISRYISAIIVTILTIISTHEVVAIFLNDVEPWLETGLEFWSELGK